jgi:hypothetical protein
MEREPWMSFQAVREDQAPLNEEKDLLGTGQDAARLIHRETPQPR